MAVGDTQALGGDPAKTREAPQQALQRKLLDGLRYLVREVLRLNQPEASDGWLTHDALWLVSKTVCDKLRAHLLSQGISGVPDRNTAVFNVLQEHGIAQPTPEGKAIWRATVESDSGWNHSFTFLRLSPALIWGAGDRPPPFSGTVRLDPGAVSASETEASTETTAALSTPVLPPPPLIDNTPPGTPDSADSLGGILRLLDGNSLGTARPDVKPATSVSRVSRLPRPPAEHPAPGNIAASDATTEEPPGERFLQWLRDGIGSHRLIINDAKALVHAVSGTVFLVSPGLFQRYVQEHPATAPATGTARLGDWRSVQKQFEHMHLHRKQQDGCNIWTCEVAGPRRTRNLHGYLLINPNTLFEQTPLDNPFLKVLTESRRPKTDAA